MCLVSCTTIDTAHIDDERLRTDRVFRQSALFIDRVRLFQTYLPPPIAYLNEPRAEMQKVPCELGGEYGFLPVDGVRFLVRSSYYFEDTPDRWLDPSVDLTDPFLPRMPLLYARDREWSFYWIVASVGPDLKRDITLEFLHESDFSTNPCLPPPDLVYDPTNGATSSGDIVMTPAYESWSHAYPLSREMDSSGVLRNALIRREKAH